MAAAQAPSSNYMLAGLNCANNVHLIIGTNPLAAARCSQSLGAGAHPVLIAPETAELHYSLQRRVDDGSVKWVRAAFRDEHLFELGREEVGRVVDAVFVTSGSREGLGSHVASLCKASRIPVNVVDAPPSLHLLPALHPQRRPPPDRRHHKRPRLQARLSHPPRNRLLAAAQPGRRMRSLRRGTAAHPAVRQSKRPVQLRDAWRARRLG
ncbi:uncharacterized protein TrAtP1_012845 [Trichoderma atroviride]|uniref:uncharacterized protein n=1 Tax=Hypocrea atroviridis TaxID=63577 RepID=UPI0033349938|nr:hypothetical protein TrAtP1_012845 [Trichoderma atroviride]